MDPQPSPPKKDFGAMAQLITFPFDLHVHSNFSFDGQGTVQEYCDRAAAGGVQEICFLEHLDLYPPDPYCRYLDQGAYAAAIAEARAKFGDRLKIRKGVEVTYLPALEREIAESVEGKGYDCVAGGVHLIFGGEGGISEEMEALETFSRHEPFEVYADYFEQVAAAVRSGLFDVICHLDLVQRYGVQYLKEFDFSRWYGQLRRILEGMIKREIALEINSSGLRQAPNSPYPSRAVLKLYRELGGRLITLGSDAHQPENLATGLDPCREMVQSLGGLEAVSFEERRPAPLQLFRTEVMRPGWPTGPPGS
jgi:histidinol-phosphatase (PHP family)